MRLFYLFIATHLYLFLCFLGATFGNFRVFRLRFNIGSFFIACQVCAAICVDCVFVIGAARCIRSDVYFASVYRGLISRPFAFTDPFCGSYGIGGFCDDKGSASQVGRFNGFNRTFVEGNSSACVQFSNARERINYLDLYVQWAVGGYQLSCI